VVHDDPTDPGSRARGEVCGAAALEVNDRWHDAPPLDHVCDTDPVPR
jgi:hypothetical protein